MRLRESSDRLGKGNYEAVVAIAGDERSTRTGEAGGRYG
jgi:hypothetical protein